LLDRNLNKDTDKKEKYMTKLKVFTMITLIIVNMAIFAMAEDNNTTDSNTTGMVTPVITQTVVQSVQTVVQPAQTVLPAQTTEVKEKKFRVGPTVRIRPLNDVIKKNEDGIVEIYMDNSNLNDYPLTVEARISVPAGIHIYGEGFGSAAAAGMVYGTFEVPPGSVRTINVDIKAEKVGDFSAQFMGTYYP
jgi:hypothetical protein